MFENLAAGGFIHHLAEVAWHDSILAPATRRSVAILLYLLGALLCARALVRADLGWQLSRSHQPDRRSEDRSGSYRATCWFWAILTLGFAMLGIARHFEVLSWLEVLAYRAWDMVGNDASARAAATTVVTMVGLVGLVVLGIWLWRARELMPRLVLAFIGLLILGVYFTLRIAPIGFIIEFMDYRLLAFRIGWLIELAGIFCIALCTIMNGWWYRPEAHAQRGPFLRAIFTK